MAKLNHFDKLQLKEQRFLTIYDFILNIIAMLSIFGSLVLGLIQINAGQLNIIYMTSIVLMVLTLFEQAVPMTNVAYYKADTDQALHDINEVISVPSTNGKKNVLMISMMQRTFMKLRMLVLSIGISKRMCCRILILMLIEAKRLRLWVLLVQEKSTLLQIMAGLYQLDSGSVRFENMDMFEIDDKDKFESLKCLCYNLNNYLMVQYVKIYLPMKKMKRCKAIFKQLDLEHLALERQIDLDGHPIIWRRNSAFMITRDVIKRYRINMDFR